MTAAMSEKKYFSLDIIVKAIRLYKIQEKKESKSDFKINDEHDKFLLEIKFDKVTFDIDGTRNGDSFYPQGRSIDFQATWDALRNKLSSNVFEIKLYTQRKDVDNFIGEASCLWPDTTLGQIKMRLSQSLPAFEQCDVTKRGQLVGNLELAFLLRETIMESRLENRRLAGSVRQDQCEEDVERELEQPDSNFPFSKMDAKMDGELNTEELSDLQTGKFTQNKTFCQFCDDDCESDAYNDAFGPVISKYCRDVLSSESEDESTEKQLEEPKMDKAIKSFPKNTIKVPGSANHDNLSFDNASLLKRIPARSKATKIGHRSTKNEMNVVRRISLPKHDRYEHAKNTETNSTPMPKFTKILTWLKEKCSPVSKNKLKSSQYTGARPLHIVKYSQAPMKTIRKNTNFILKNAKPEQFKRRQTISLEGSKRGFSKPIRKSRRRYYYVKCIKPIHAFERHQHCLKKEPLVPPKMGWRWDIQNPEFQNGWRPGCVKKLIRQKIEYFPENSSEHPSQRLNISSGKKRISRIVSTNNNDLEIKRKQLKRYFKDIGFRRCGCNKPVIHCTCRSFMEKHRLEKAVDNLAEILGQQNLRHIVTLSDTTESEGELHGRVAPTTSLTKFRFPTKGLPGQGQYSEGEQSFQRSVHDRSIGVQTRVVSAQRNSEFGPKSCKPKVQVISYLKNRHCDKGKMSAFLEFEKDDKEVNANSRDKLNQKKDKTSFEPVKRKGRRGNTIIDGSQPPTNSMQNCRESAGADIQLQTDEFSTKRNKSKKHSQCSPHQTPRVTKPISRWERIQRKRPTRPQWDDSIYIPPPLKPPTSGQEPTESGPKPSSLSKNYQRKTEFEQKLPDNEMKANVVQTKSIYHRNCLKATNVVKDVNTEPSTS